LTKCEVLKEHKRFEIGIEAFEGAIGGDTFPQAPPKPFNIICMDVLKKCVSIS
jgi:hypothetical protein